MQGLCRQLGENIARDLVHILKILVTDTNSFCNTDYKVVRNTTVKKLRQPFTGLQNQKMCRLRTGKATMKISDH